MATTGEKNFSTEGREAKKQTFEPCAAQDWDVILHSTAASVGKKEGGAPYVKGCYFEALGSQSYEGGPNKRIYSMFFTSLKPGSDGVIMPDRANQIVGLARALGTELTIGTTEVVMAGDVVQECLDARQLAQWLKDNDGAKLSLHSKIERSKEYGDKSVVDYFIETNEENPFKAG